MAVTAGGTPYVESSDLVANYPAVSLALAEHIDDLPAAILQVVRATDTTQRSTTSATFVDVTGMAVTITPQKNTSAVMVIAIFSAQQTGSGTECMFQVTDSANSAISGAGPYSVFAVGTGTALLFSSQTLIGYATPATTSAVTYKMRFSRYSGSGTVYVRNDQLTGQIYAIEVSA